MRISTQSFYQQGVAGMAYQQQRVFRVQQQISANTRIITASDDPVGAARALGVSETLAKSDQYKTTRDRATLALSNESSALDSVTSILQNVRSTIVQAGNGTLSDADRTTLATTLQSSLDQLVGLANTGDGNGQYMFGGHRSGSEPFVKQADGSYQYIGDQGQRLMQIDTSRQMASSDDGRSVFQSVQGGSGYVASSGSANTGSAVFSSISTVDATAANYGSDFSISFTGGNYTVTTKATPSVTVATGAYQDGNPIAFGGLQVSVSGTPADGDKIDVSTAKNAGTDMFGAISDLVAALRKPIAGGGPGAQAQLLNALSTANVKMKNSYDNVATVSSSVGSRLNEIEALDTAGSSRKLLDQTYLSQLQDLDLASALSDVVERKTALTATQKTFAALQDIALFNYVK
ncbi:flagellar hook-associated protein FlgL [Variovorax ginsengisoli]|uniref:Flagellar hook-associated protein 3 FlgL n=1 Tax=Variovorax ginsengisoli TaxID=363844 RepID=A0ABT9SFY9_9BURK|nr:flagellar hook-associated protein FlgL [Variovorax ginsengisoli]MDP9902287.1 flagellar hook-associated protein 3 FlgL [Variovorax ginsengisoli]